MKIAKLATALTLAFTLAMPIASAQSADPAGTWQTTTGESRFDVSLCGDGTELCAKLVWLRDDAKTAENLPYLGQFVVEGADATAANRWRGTVNYAGESVSGTVKLTSENAMSLSGCRGLGCRTFELVRV